ncbi:hypothetical protein [Streptomyces akebiae]|uniref:Uncharacterized protein n=1 Tax=Streptomyces akebiae TaxID=2865673 RepID=A0ABX8XXM5_9ACTN|nr:hypothetical protein [Streptomyces akebiae]QYX80383.1 hypothetical protein K1J60_31145 [Streptomyces akebiae]
MCHRGEALAPGRARRLGFASGRASRLARALPRASGERAAEHDGGPGRR